MNVSKEEAHQTLVEIDSVIFQTQRALAQSGAGKMLILWGLIWVIGYSTTQFFPAWQGRQWLPLVLIGTITSMIAGARSRGERADKSQGRRIGIFWLVLFLYAFLWIMLLHPAAPVAGEDWARQTGAFFATVPMFAYIVCGLWLGRFFVWLGAIVTLLTIAGFYLLPHWFSLWMAITGGGSLIVAGLFIRKFWR
jgi:hypothetical protein